VRCSLTVASSQVGSTPVMLQAPMGLDKSEAARIQHMNTYPSAHISGTMKLSDVVGNFDLAPKSAI